MKFFIQTLLLVLSLSTVTGQTGREFWLGAPDISTDYGDTPAKLYITALYKTKVTISKPADLSFTPLVLYLDEMEYGIVDFETLFGVTTEWENVVTNSTVNKGILIESEPGEITVYYDLSHSPNNRDILPLKGESALGQEFTVSTQNWLDNNNNPGVQPRNGFVIVATEDNTTVRVLRNGNILAYVSTDTVTLTLNRGESFAFRAGDAVYEDEHLNGIEVLSNKDIAISIYDDALVESYGNGFPELFADQIVPKQNLGTKYFVQRGFADDSLDVVFITPTQNNTEIFIDGVSQGLYAKNSVFRYFIPINKYVSIIETSFPVLLNHMTGIDKMVAGAQLPSFEDCIGSYEVVFKRPLNAEDNFYSRIIAQNETNSASPYYNQAIHNFYIVTGIDTNKLSPGYFEYSYDSAFVYIPDSSALHGLISSMINRTEEVKIFNKVSKFHFGAIMGGPKNGPKYGYFSNYTDVEPSVGIGGFSYVKDTTYCNLNSVQLAASGGIDYSWTALNPAHINLLSNDSIASPIFSPDSSGIYIFVAHVKSPCHADYHDTITIRCFVMPANAFETSDQTICSGDTITITNNTTTTYVDKMVWNFDPPDTNITHFTSQTFEWVFPRNNTDSILQYYITLTSYSPGDYCVNQKNKIIFVKPFVEASIDADTTVGCAPLEIQFINNTTSGHNTDTALIYDWDLGNGNYPSSKHPLTIYPNNTSSDSVYNAILKVETPYGCIDRDTLSITVFPRTNAIFSNDTNNSCSPIVVTLDPSGSLNADSLFWYFDLAGTDSSSSTDLLDPVILTYEDTSWTTGPDTLFVTLVTKNSYGCIDTSDTPELIVFPNIVADFSIDDDSICDGDSIRIINNSYGFNPAYDWTNVPISGDIMDTTIAFYNRTENDTIYNIRLKATSYICSDVMDTNLVVHPYIRASFGNDFGNDGKNCSPVDVIIDNNSIRVDNYFWDFGDGNTSTTDTTKIIHPYINPNPYSDTTYTIRLIASNNQGCVDSVSETITILPEVVADFTILDPVVCSPDFVRFVNNSTGSNLKYFWDYGDKQTSLNANPSYSWLYTNDFDSDTIYTAILTVENNIGCIHKDTNTVEVFAKITSLFGTTVEEDCSPFTVELDNFSSPSAKIFRWDLGSAGSSTDYIPSPDPTYSNPAPSLTEDTILISLAATGVDDPLHWAICADTFTQQVVVYPEIEVLFSLSDTASCQPLITTITNDTKLKDSTAFTWELDNIFLSSETEPGTIPIENTANDSSIHTITLYGNTKHKCKDTVAHNVVVYSLVDANFSIDKEAICSYDSIYIDRTASEGGITSYEWNFNGEATLTTATPTFYYSSFDNLLGAIRETKTITLTVRNTQNCIDSTSNTVIINPNVSADFDLDTHQICYPHFSVFTNNSTNADSYKWEFGDGLPSTEVNPIHEFGNFSNIVDSIYYISMTARSQYDCYDTHRDTITINAKPNANFYFPIQSACPPFEVEMINNSEGDNLTYDWDFAGEGASTSENPTFVFSNSSNQIVTKDILLEIFSQNGCSDTATNEITVYPNVDTNFTNTIDAGCSPLNVDFESEADPTNIRKIIWFVDDIAWATTVDPTFTFENQTPDNDTFNVKFKVYSVYNCSDSATTEIVVYPSPEVYFTPSPVTMVYDTENDQTTITLNNKTTFQDNWEYQWDFGDGNTTNNTEQTFTYTYGDRFWGDANNDYRIPVLLTGWNGNNPECSDTFTYNIIITPPEPEIDIFEDVTGCAPLTVDFSAYTKYNDPNDFYWEFNANGATSTEENPVFTFTESGSYTVRLTVKGDGGSSSDYKIVDVLPQPVVNFSFNDTVVFIDVDEVFFYNHTTDGQTYQWFYGLENDEIGTPLSTEFDPVHTFQDTGTYYIALISESIDECMDTMFHPIPIRVLELGELEFPNAFLFHPSNVSDEYSTNQGEGEGNVYLFYPKHMNVVDYHLEIYNRWGTLLFESFDINRGWNGIFDGEPAQHGVYLWRARGRFANGQPFDKSGDVTLLKGKRE